METLLIAVIVLGIACFRLEISRSVKDAVLTGILCWAVFGIIGLAPLPANPAAGTTQAIAGEIRKFGCGQLQIGADGRCEEPVEVAQRPKGR